MWRLAITILLLGTTALFLRARNKNEVLPVHEAIAAFPRQLAAWTGTEVPIPSDVLDSLGPGQFLLRVYRNTASPAALAQEPYVDLFIAYFPSQRAGDTIHSPKNCLPGSGWSPVEARRMQVSLPGHAPFEMNRYIIAKGENRQLVLYWYWAHDRAVASEYWSKFYLVADATRLNRSDGSLVRVTTPVRPDETADEAQRRLLSFAGNVVPVLDRYIPK